MGIEEAACEEIGSDEIAADITDSADDAGAIDSMLFVAEVTDDDSICEEAAAEDEL